MTSRAKAKRTKIAVSLPPEQVEQAREAVARGEAESVSGYVSAALAEAARVSQSLGSEENSLALLVAEMTAELGEPSAEAYAWADAALRMTN
jgi:Arc/MetJ-type ribon-helix-helix transcriptional regulator